MKSKNETSASWVFTFGAGQAHAGRYVRLHGTFDEARKKMFLLFGEEWAQQYSENEWHELAERAYAEGISVESEMPLTNFQRAKLAMNEGKDAFGKWLCGAVGECDDCPFASACKAGHSGIAEWLSRPTSKDEYFWKDF